MRQLLNKLNKLLLIGLLVPVIGCEADTNTTQSATPPPPQVVTQQTPTTPPPASAEALTPAPAATTAYVAGTHYQLLPAPVPTSDPAKIEVTEVFWYGCSHCFTFEPLVNAWSQTLAEDVVYQRSPAIWHPTMELHARAYYTAKAVGNTEALHKAIFEAMNLKKAKLASEDEIAEVFVANGVAREKFTKTFNSFGVNSALKQADARQRGYQIKGTPEIIVNGKYRVAAEMAGGHQGMLKVADYLIGVERQAAAP